MLGKLGINFDHMCESIDPRSHETSILPTNKKVPPLLGILTDSLKVPKGADSNRCRVKPFSLGGEVVYGCFQK